VDPPLDELRTRFRCPKCGNPNITVWFEVPNNPVAVAARKKINMEDYSDDPDVSAWDIL
jgi:hypothetical protein